MAVLAAMTGIALAMVFRVAKAFWLESAGAKLILGPVFETGLSSHAMQQGGIGLILTTLDPDCAPNGGDVLPRHAGHLHGIFADRWRRQRLAECRWSSAGYVGTAAGNGSG